jgi:hypothetical protein
MLRLADQIESLIYPLQELQDRLSLEVPASFIREESIRESADQQKATYSMMHYLTEDNAPDDENPATLDVEPIVEALAEDVLGKYENITWDMYTDELSRSTRDTVVSVYWTDNDTRTAATEQIDGVPYDVVPLTIYAGDRVYNLATDGNSYVILKDGQVLVEDLPSPAFALGQLVPHLREELAKIENTEGIEPSSEDDFLAGVASTVVDMPDVSDEAKEHFVQFYELTTLKDWDATQDE